MILLCKYHGTHNNSVLSQQARHCLCRAGAPDGSRGAVLGAVHPFLRPGGYRGGSLKSKKGGKTMLDKFLLRLYIWLDDTKRLITSILGNKQASAQIPKRILDELARCFLPDIIAFYEAPEGREEYEKWKLSQTQQTPQNASQLP